MSGCQSYDTEQSIQTSSVISETYEHSQTTVAADEMINISGREIPIDSEVVTLLLSDTENATDISELGKLYNLRSLTIFPSTDGNTPCISGFDALTGCETLESIIFEAGFDDPNDIYVLDTLPELKNLTICGIEAYEDWDLGLRNIKKLNINGTFELSRITHLGTLESLALEYNYSDDLTPITELSGLTALAITECGFDDYSPLLGLDDLQELFISSVPMTEDMYDRIAERFPECHITIVNESLENPE